MADQLFEPFRVVQRIDLRRRHDLDALGDRRAAQFGGQVGFVEGQLAADDLEILDRIAAAEGRHVDEVDEHRAALDVPRKRWRGRRRVGAFDQAGDVGDDEAAIVTQVDQPRFGTSVVNG